MMRAFGHPIHMMLNHFPIALLLTATVWDALSLFLRLPPGLARWTMLAGLVASVPTALAGMLDWGGVESKADTSAPRIANRHVALVSAALVPFVLSVWLHGSLALPWILALDLLGCALLMAGAWHGGELVVRHGVGMLKEASDSVASIPPSRADRIGAMR